jgi:glutaredoxin
MKSKAIYYHAGCPVCVEAEQGIASLLDPAKVNVEIVNLGEKKELIPDAMSNGVKSVPAILLDKQVFHINFGASLDDIR